MRPLVTLTAFALAGCGPKGIAFGTCGDYSLFAPDSSVSETALHEKCKLDGTSGLADWDTDLTTITFSPDTTDLTAGIHANFLNEDLVVGQTITLSDAAAGQAYIGDVSSPSDPASLTGGTIHVLKAGKAGVTDADGYTVDYWKIDWDVTWGDPSGDAAWYTTTGEDWLAIRQVSTAGGGSSGSYYYYYYSYGSY